MNILLYAGSVVGAIAALFTAARFIGSWFGRVVGELVEQTTVFRELSKQQALIYRATLRIEKRQLEDRQARANNGSRT